MSVHGIKLATGTLNVLFKLNQVIL